MNEHELGTPAGVLDQYALGLMSKEHAVEALRLRDYSELLIALSAAGFALPIASEAELAAQVETFVRIWKNS